MDIDKMIDGIDMSLFKPNVPRAFKVQSKPHHPFHIVEIELGDNTISFSIRSYVSGDHDGNPVHIETDLVVSGNRKYDGMFYLGFDSLVQLYDGASDKPEFIRSLEFAMKCMDRLQDYLIESGYNTNRPDKWDESQLVISEIYPKYDDREDWMNDDHFYFDINPR